MFITSIDNVTITMAWPKSLGQRAAPSDYCRGTVVVQDGGFFPADCDEYGASRCEIGSGTRLMGVYGMYGEFNQWVTLCLIKDIIGYRTRV